MVGTTLFNSKVANPQVVGQFHFTDDDKLNFRKIQLDENIAQTSTFGEYVYVVIELLC